MRGIQAGQTTSDFNKDSQFVDTTVAEKTKNSGEKNPTNETIKEDFDID